MFTSEKSDYHIHSKYSPDSKLEPHEIIVRANRLNLKTIAVTDHDTVAGGLETKRINQTDLEIIPGVEVRTDQGDLIGLDLYSEIESRELEEVCKEIKEKAGKVYVPHPFDRVRSSSLGESIYLIVEEIDYIEAFNRRCILDRFNVSALDFAEKHGIPVLTGSDAHFSFEIGSNLNKGLYSKAASMSGFCLTKLYKVIKSLQM